MRRAHALLVIAILLVAGGAHADDKQRALDLFEKSARAYRDGRFQEAVDLLTEARKLSRAPVLLYDLGRAYEALGKPAEAADAYAQYLAEDEKAPDRRAIEGRIATIRAQAAELARARSVPVEEPKKPEPAPPAPPPHKPMVVWPWIVAGAGAVAIGTGIGLGIAAKSAHDDAEREPVQTRASSRQDKAESLARISTIVVVAGSAIAAVGIGLGIYLTVSPTGTIGASGSFR